jgi:pimeloyl-ACP methyl ester carboxylesterase
METTTAKQELDDGEQLTQADFQTIAMPTLAVYGEYSHCIPSCDNLKELMQDCQVVLQPKVGHFHPIVRPKMFVETLMQFLQAHPFKADRPDLNASLVEHRQDVVVERASL